MKKYGKREILLAIAKVNEGISIPRSARLFKIPVSTLKYNVKGKYRHIQHNQRKVNNPAIEKLLSDYILASDESVLPVTSYGYRRLVYELADNNRLPHNFNTKLKMAGLGWYRMFITHNKQIARIIHAINKSRG